MAIGARTNVLVEIERIFEGGIVAGLSDRQLVEAFGSGTDHAAEAAFAALIDRHGAMVLRVCRAILRNHHDAQDAFQATFLVLAQRARSLWVRDSLGPWLHGVACRVSACSKRAANRRRQIERRAAEAGTINASTRGDDHDDWISILYEELGRLPDKYRATIVLCDLEGFTYEAAASQMGLPIGTVKSRLARGRDRLRDRLVKRRGMPATGAFAAGLSRMGGNLIVPSVLAHAAMRNAACSRLGDLVPGAVMELANGAIKMMSFSAVKLAAIPLAAGCVLVALAFQGPAPGSRADVPQSAESRPSTSIERATAKPKAAEPASSNSGDEPSMTPANPQPWEATVRIRIPRPTDFSFGSGTIVVSSPDESIVLTAASHFKNPKAFTVPDPVSTFPFDVYVDLFDGKLTGTKPAQVHFLETVKGTLVDRDFQRNVALVRIRPGRVLPAARVVPVSWAPKIGMRLLTVGCSEGRDATAWHTRIASLTSGLVGEPTYEGIACSSAPKQGRTGGGLFTTDGYLAGVCNFAEPQNDLGLYARPKAIYSILKKNGLAASAVEGWTDEPPYEPSPLDQVVSVERMRRGMAKPSSSREGAESSSSTHGDPLAVKPSQVNAATEERLQQIDQKLNRILERLDKIERERGSQK